MFPAHPVAVITTTKRANLAVPITVAFATVLPVMDAVYRFLKSCFPTSVFMIVPIVLTVRAMRLGVLHLRQESLPI